MPLYASGSFVPSFIEPEFVPDAEARRAGENEHREVATCPPVEPGRPDEFGNAREGGVNKHKT